MAKGISRRDMLAGGLKISLVGMTAGLACSAGAADKICADPKQLPNDQIGLRNSLNYVELSNDQSKTCGACSFFSAPKEGCGNCMIFNGPANAKGHCDSWSLKT